MSLPTGFTYQESIVLQKNINDLFERVLPQQVDGKLNEFNNFFRFSKNKQEIESDNDILDKLETISEKMDEIFEQHPYLLLRMPKSFEVFVEKLRVHLPLYHSWLVDQEIKQKLLIQAEE